MKHLNIRLIVGLSCLICLAQTLVAQEDERTLIKAETVYTMNGEPLSPGQVLVENGKIVSVGETVDAGGSDVRTLDLGPGSVLMPGLVDAYSQTGLGSDGTDEITNEITPGFAAVQSIDWEQHALRRKLESGTTTLCVCPGRQNVFSGVSAIIKSSDRTQTVLTSDGPLVANLCSDPASGNRARARPDSIFVRQPTNRMGVVWIMRNTFDKVKRADEKEVYPQIREVLDGKRPFMVFSRMSHDIQSVATLADEFGYSPIVVGGQEAHKVKDLLIEKKYPVILERIGTGAISGSENSELCWNNAGVLAEAGVPIAFSGDQLLEQARFAHRHGLAREDALAAITRTPSQLLGISDRVGMIAEGRDADFIALSGDPLELTTSIHWVMVNGQTFGMEKE